MQIIVLVILAILSSCFIKINSQNTTNPEVPFIDDVQDSVKNEKFPEIRFQINAAFNSYYIEGIRVTNLKNLGNTTYTSLLNQIDLVFFSMDSCFTNNKKKKRFRQRRVYS